MAELIVVGFEGKYRAAEVLEQLEQLNATWALDLKDAVAAYRTDGGKLRIDGSVQPTSKEEAAGGALLGSLFGALLIAPFTAGVSAAAAAAAIGAGAVTLGATGAVIGADDAAEYKREFGISEEFVEQVGGMIQPGHSAVFLLARTTNPAAVAEKFRGYGGTVLRTTLSAKAAAKLQDVLASRTPAVR
jgi:uncharacterized membrane protein